MTADQQQLSLKAKVKVKHGFFGDNSEDAFARSETIGILLSKQEAGKRLSLRERLFLILADPSTSRAAAIFGVVQWTIILLSSLAYVYETMAWVTDISGPAPWLLCKVVFQIFYSVEAAVRTLTFIPIYKIHHDFFVWLDLITIIPFWSRFVLFPSSLTIDGYLDFTTRPMTIRVFESLAMIRLLKLTRYYEGSHLIARALTKSLSQLLVPLFMLTIMIFFFSMIIYDIEWDASIAACAKLWRAEGVTTAFMEAKPGGVDWGCDACTLTSTTAEGRETLRQQCLTCRGYPDAHPECLGVAFVQQFRDLPRAMWYIVVTVTTVGYGDMYPVKWQGQLFGSVIILSGIIFLAMPLSIVGNNFAETFEERRLVTLQRNIRRLLVENGFKPHDVVLAYRQLDINGDGLIAFEEFVTFCQGQLHLDKLSKPEFYDIWRKMDLNGSGVINFSEFTSMLFPNVSLEAVAASDSASFKLLMKKDEGALRQAGHSGGAHHRGSHGAVAAASTKQLEDSMAQLLSAVHAMQQTLGAVDARVSSMEATDAAIAARCERIEAAQGMLASRCDGIEATMKLLADRPRHKSRRHLDGVGDVSKGAPPVRSSNSRRAEIASVDPGTSAIEA